MDTHPSTVCFLEDLEAVLATGPTHARASLRYPKRKCYNNARCKTLRRLGPIKLVPLPAPNNGKSQLQRKGVGDLYLIFSAPQPINIQEKAKDQLTPFPPFDPTVTPETHRESVVRIGRLYVQTHQPRQIREFKATEVPCSFCVTQTRICPGSTAAHLTAYSGYAENFLGWSSMGENLKAALDISTEETTKEAPRE